MQKQIDIIRWEQGAREARHDVVAIEEPLEIRINGEPFSVTMRTPGDDFALCAGFLYAEGVIQSRSDVRFMGCGDEKTDPDWQNMVDVRLESDWKQGPHAARWQRSTTISSACGVCGKASLEAVRNVAAPLQPSSFQVASEVVISLPGRMRSAQSVFDQTGGLHAAALFDAQAGLISLREDVGRHNAVDKLIGGEVLAGSVPLAERILLVSGRASFEIMQKAGMARLPIVCAISAPSSLAVQLARDLNMTLVGFLRGDTMNIYTGEERITA